jgi:hypothetical protein
MSTSSCSRRLRASAAAFVSLTALLVAACSSATDADADADSEPNDVPPRGAADAGTPGTDSSTADAATPPVDPVTCDASGCGAMVGSIRIFGFPTKEEAERVVAVLDALPASLTRAANFDVTRDAISQTGCPDPTRTPVSSLPAHCGYAGAEIVGTRVLLKVRDATMKLLPLRLDHVLTDFAARDWFLAHQDEVISMRYGRTGEIWNGVCFACPADAQEACLSHDLSVEYVHVMRDFTSSVAGTLLKTKAWGGIGVAWKKTNGEDCTAPERQAWIEDRLIAEKPATIVSQGLDIVKLCGPGQSSVQYTIRTTSGTADVTLATVGGASGGLIIPRINAGTATTTPTTKEVNMRNGLVRVVGRSDKPFVLELVSCP